MYASLVANIFLFYFVFVTNFARALLARTGAVNQRFK